MAFYSQADYYKVLHEVMSSCNLPSRTQDFLWGLIYERENQESFSKPMMWIGIYIALASFLCILLMVADLLHGLKNKKLWFPCKYFTLNAASLSVIAVAMKLTMDLNNSMPGNADQAAKLGSIAFMCTMMANLLPSLASMDSKELLTNIIALGVLVITLIVNICIQIKTGVATYNYINSYLLSHYDREIAAIYGIMLFLLLIIYTCSALMILKSKQILESKYQASRETALNELEGQQPGQLTVEKLKQHVINHWIMAGTGSPQFMVACSATTSAAGVICAISTLLHVIVIICTGQQIWDCESDYKESISVILVTQFIGYFWAQLPPFLDVLHP